MTELHLAFEHPEAEVTGKRLIATVNLKDRAGKMTPKTALEFVVHSLQFLRWMPSYSWEKEGVGDMVAGITVGVVLIAQGVAYGMLTGMKPYYGLYAGLVPAAVYGLLGTSRQMHIGPFALVSLLVAEGVAEVPGIHADACLATGMCQPTVDCAAGICADKDALPVPMAAQHDCDALDPAGMWTAAPSEVTDMCQEYIDACLTMSLMVGFGYLCMWGLRLGFVVDLLSDPMMSALTTAAGCLICTSQMKHLLGLTMVPRGSFVSTWQVILSNIQQTNPVTLAIGVSSLALMLGIAKVNAKIKDRTKIPIPEQLIAVILFTSIVYFGQLDDPQGDHPVLILGEVPQGLPVPHVPDTRHWPELVHAAGVVTIIGFSLVIATGKTFAEKHGYEVDPNQELLALGMANFLGGMVCCYPASSSLSRSALANAVGAKTAAFNFWAVSVIILVLLVLYPTLRCLPNATLAAIVVLAFKSIIKQVNQVPALWHLKRTDCIVWLCTFFGILLLGVTSGMLVGVGSSLLVMLKADSRPPHAVLGRLGDTDVFRNLERYPSASEVPGVFIFRFDAALNFANKNFFKSLLLRYVVARQLAGNAIRVIVLDLYGVHDIDSSAIKMLKTVLADLRAGKGARAIAGGGSIEVVVAGCKGPVRDILTRGGVISAEADDGDGGDNGDSIGGFGSQSNRSSLVMSPTGSMTEEEWNEAMQEVESAGANSLCHQFVLLKTAVKYAEWRVMNITDRVVMPSGETIVTPREDSPVRLDDGSGSSGSAMQQGASSAESGSGGGVERSENPMSVTAL
jgi:high affinity sulfate transporter 1